MKISEVTPLTVVYARDEHPTTYYRTYRDRVVVLATGPWVPVYGDGKREGRYSRWGNQDQMSGYQALAPGEKPSRPEANGWLVLMPDYATDEGRVLTDEALLGPAETALAAVQAGGLPALPSGVRLALVPARQIVMTWAEHLEQQERSRIASERAAADMAAQEAEAAGARERITSVVGEKAVDLIAHRLQYPSDWVNLETLLDGYHAAKSDSEALISRR